MQGAKVVQPFADKFKVTFPVAVDSADVFGQAFDLKAIPVSYFVDEVGIIRLSGGGPSRKLLGDIRKLLDEPVQNIASRQPILAGSRNLETLRRTANERPKDAFVRLALAQALHATGQLDTAVAEARNAIALDSESADSRFFLGMVLLTMGDRDAALQELIRARDLDSKNWRIRKQIWALQNPEKFYSGNSPDYGWQREELAREKSQRDKSEK